MTILQGTMQDGTIIPVQVDAQGRLVAEGLPGPAGPAGPPGPQGPVGQDQPAGSVIWFAGASTPAGWLYCNGQAVSRSTYAALFAAIGTLYGAGNGSTTFNLPDLRGEFVRGWDDGRGVDAGRARGSAQGYATARPSTAFTTTADGGHNHGVHGIPSPGGAYEGGPYTARDNSTSIATDWAGSHGHVINGGGDAETRPRNIALRALIRT